MNGHPGGGVVDVAIAGAGPYGPAVAAHLRRAGIGSGSPARRAVFTSPGAPPLAVLLPTHASGNCCAWFGSMRHSRWPMWLPW